MSYRGSWRSYDRSEHERRLRRVLRGVGDASLGEWLEEGLGGSGLLHLKRRLTDAEWGDRPWGMDLRKTAEGDARLLAAGCPRKWAPDEWR
jgi:hypothetical protein